MLSLSIFCSSQTISLAIYNEKKLIFLKKKKILDNKIEGIFKILKECTNKFELKKISQIYFSTGPGSFTALRSIKVISQALALSSNSVLRTTSSFSPLIASIQNKDKKVLACFKSTNNKFFYQIFEKIGKIFKPKYSINFGDENQLISYYLEKKQNCIGLPLYSSDKLNNLNTKKIKPIIKKVDASHLGLSIFLGYASKKTKIFYHNTYYE
jgi:tRNA A37 threonylcarbamoyladenosine modification protein TsaB